MRSYACLDDAEVQESRTAVQRISTATSPPGTDLIRPKQARALHQRPVSTSMRLVHTEGIGRKPAIELDREQSFSPAIRVSLRLFTPEATS